MQEKQQERFFTVKEVADGQLIGFKERKIREFIADGSLKAKNLGNKERPTWRIPQSAIDEFLEKRPV